jgi:hypothetical protein
MIPSRPDVMQVVRDRPPLFDLIDKKFNVRGKPVIFAWGATIFVPSGSLEVAPQLKAHEAVHGGRQLLMHADLKMSDEERIEAWWMRYIDDIEFRRKEETLAHIAEYRHLCEHAGGRNQRRRHMSIISSKLSNPLYGPLMNKAQAREVLEHGYPSHS